MPDEQSAALPVLRVIAAGNAAAQEAFLHALDNAPWAQPWYWARRFELEGRDWRARAVCTRKHRAIVAVMPTRASATVAGAFAPDVVLVLGDRQRVSGGEGPAALPGVRNARDARAVVWLAPGARDAEERSMRAALRAAGHDGDAAAVVRHALDPSLEALASALDAAVPHRPDCLEVCVHVPRRATVFVCRRCGRALTRPVRHVPQPPIAAGGAKFRYNVQMFPEGGVWALGRGGAEWGERQVPPTEDLPHGVALIAWADLVPDCKNIGTRRGGCCGSVPAGGPTLACPCDAPVAYGWSECVFASVVALRLDAVAQHGPTIP